MTHNRAMGIIKHAYKSVAGCFPDSSGIRNAIAALTLETGIEQKKESINNIATGLEEGLRKAMKDGESLKGKGLHCQKCHDEYHVIYNEDSTFNIHCECSNTQGKFYSSPEPNNAKIPSHYDKKVTPWDLEQCMESSGDAFVDARRTDAIEYAFRMKDDLIGDLKKARHCLDAAIVFLESKE